MYRVTIFLLIGVIALFVLLHLVRLMGCAEPGTEDLVAEPPGWLERWGGKVAMVLLGILFMLLAVDHILESQEPPPKYYEPPKLEKGVIIPGHFHENSGKK